MDDKPPSQKIQFNQRVSPKYRKPNRDIRLICGLLARSRQVGFGALGVACLRAGEQPVIQGMVISN